MATTFNDGGGTGLWNLVGNWSGGIPTLSDDAIIDEDCTMDVVGACKTLVINSSKTLDCNGFNLEVGGGGTTVDGTLLCDSGEMKFWPTQNPGVETPWALDVNGGTFNGGTGDHYVGSFKALNNASAVCTLTAGTMYMSSFYDSSRIILQGKASTWDPNGGTVVIQDDCDGGKFGAGSSNAVSDFYNLVIAMNSGSSCSQYSDGMIVAGDFTISGGSFSTDRDDFSVSGQTNIGYDPVTATGSGIDSNFHLSGGTYILGTGNTTDCWVGNWDTGLITCTGATITMAGKFFHETNAIFQASGGSISAYNWSRASDGYGGTGCGTIISHGDETWGSSDNMETKGIFGSDSTATVNCPQNYGNGQLQKVSGTATPTIIAGGYGAPMEPAGNSTVITTGGRVIYIEQRGSQSEGFDGHFWNLIISGNSTKDIGANQNSTWRVLNDFTIQAGSSFSLEDMGSGVTTAGDTYSIDVSGAFIVEGTFYGNTGATNAPNQHFAAVKVASGGAFYATTGTTTIFKGGAGNPLGEGDFNFFARYGGATLFHHNSGTVVFDTFAAGDASWYFDVTEAPFYNVTFGAGPSSAYDMYMNGKSDAYGMNVDNDLTIGIAGTTKMGTFRSFGRPVVVSGTLKILDPGGSNISRIYTTADSTYDVGNFVLEANTRMQPPSDGMTVRGNWINNGGQFY